MRVATTVKELRRSSFFSGPSAVAPPELLSCRQVADWETGVSPIISVLPDTDMMDDSRKKDRMYLQ